VILLDNFNDYYSPIIKQRNVALLEARYPTRVLDGSFIIIRGSINDEELLKMIFNKYKITHIAHLAVRIFIFRFHIKSFSSSSGTCWCSFIHFSNWKIYGN
jgi:UDP-glucose 4-epimerase